MAPKKKLDTSEAVVPSRTYIWPKSPAEWRDLAERHHETAWRTLKVRIQVAGQLLAGKPASLDAAAAMVRARGLEDTLETSAMIEDPEARSTAAKEIARTEALCEFHRRIGHPGLWLPANNIKAAIKECASITGIYKEIRGSRGAFTEGLFVVGSLDEEHRHWIYLAEAPDDVVTSIAHTTGPMGPVQAIKRNEMLWRPRLTFFIRIATCSSVSDKFADPATLVRVFEHMALNGIGACRSQGNGMLEGFPEIEEVE